MKATKGSKEVKEVKTEKELSAIEKVRKLMEFTVENGATEAEVENAIKAAQRLMMKHNLDQKDIEVTSNDVNITSIKSTWDKKVLALEIKSFENSLLTVIGNIYSCKIIITRGYLKTEEFPQGRNTYDIVGLPEDREMVKTIFESILPQIRNLYKTRYKESDKSISQFKFTSSYCLGFLEGLKEKMSADRETFLKKADMKQFELIVIKKEDLVKEWISDNMNITKGKARGVSVDKDAFDKGVQDGSEKGLNKQLGK